MYFTKVSLMFHLSVSCFNPTDKLAQFLSVMAVAIMGTNAAVAAQPKTGLEERACFCK